MARPKEHREVEKWTIHIDAKLAKQVRELTADSFTGKPMHGARAALIEALFRELLADIAARRKAFDPISGTLYTRKQKNVQTTNRN